MIVSDLTKEELLRLIRSKGLDHCFDETDIRWVRYESMVAKARKIEDDATEKMKEFGRNGNLKRYLEESDKFSLGMRMWDQAQEFLNNKE